MRWLCRFGWHRWLPVAVGRTGIKFNTVFYRCARCKVGGTAREKWMECGADAYAWAHGIPVIPGDAVPDDLFTLEQPAQRKS